LIGEAISLAYPEFLGIKATGSALAGLRILQPTILRPMAGFFMGKGGGERQNRDWQGKY